MSDTRVWKCNAGRFTGVVEGNVIHLLGIRYASALRYQPPVPYTYPAGVHAMTVPAPMAIQAPSPTVAALLGTGYSKVAQEESCQYLSLTVPADVRPGERLPVMLWIHGGSYRDGGCDQYGRMPLVSEGRVIVVGANYRLGVLGFVRDHAGNLANLGLLDLIAAMRWIRANIVAFGGDSENVTIFGQSAGADAVRSLMLARGTDHLYRRAIMESDPLGLMRGREHMDREVLERFNRVPVDASVAELRRAQADIIAHVPEKSIARHMVFGPHLGVDPLPVAADVSARWDEVAPAHELLIGSNTRELAAYIAGRPALIALDRFPLTRPLFERVLRGYGERIFGTGTRRFARDYRSHGGTVFRYVFSWYDAESTFGACHALDTVLLFDAGKVRPDAAALMGLPPAKVKQIGAPLRKIWTDFARTGTISRTSIPGMIDIKPVP